MSFWVFYVNDFKRCPHAIKFHIFGFTKIQLMKFHNLLIVLFLGTLFSCSTKDTSLVTITGVITNPIGEEVTFKAKDTTYTTTADENGAFSISFPLDSARHINFGHGRENTAMYIYPGDEIKLTIDTKMFDETITYQESPKSSYLAKKYLIRESYDFLGKVFYSSNKQEYEAFLEEFKQEILKELNVFTDSLFVSKEMENIDKYTSYYARRYERIENLSESAKLYKWKESKIRSKFNFYAALDSLNASGFDTMLVDYSKQLNGLLSQVEDTGFVSKTSQSIIKTTSRWKERKTAKDNLPKSGESAIDFTYPDKDSLDHSLSGFKGSLVYVDVWATWCGPCVAEIPSLAKLEADYHDKNITFLSVSVDTDRDAWIKMVAEKELGGVQLWANGWSEITKSYAIFGIPRFMLFDVEGNVISTDAPRPSDGEIRSLIDANL